MNRVRYLIVDANNALHRCHYAQSLTDRKGRPVSGTFGIMKMVRSLTRQFRPRFVIVAWDQGKSAERLALYPEYKAQREASRSTEDKEAIARQRADCQRIFSTLPVRQVMVDGIEADDAIGVLCEQLTGRKVIISNDHDFVQLVKDDTELWLPNKNLLLTPATVEKFLGFPVKHYVLWKCLVGDTSDNIKGIHGIGPKKATAIILNGLGGGKKPAINAEQQKILDRNKYLITIGAVLKPAQVDAVLSLHKKEKTKTIDFEPVRMAFVRMGFKSLYFNFDLWSAPFKRLIKKVSG